jgi:hypothetical protein
MSATATLEQRMAESSRRPLAYLLVGMWKEATAAMTALVYFYT